MRNDDMPTSGFYRSENKRNPPKWLVQLLKKAR